MDGSQSKPSAAPAPFLIKTYEMVDDPQTDFLVSWSESGCSFVVWNPPDFSKELLPKYFKHNNFSSFVRQLNTYGFRKIDPEQWEFANEEFIRGEKHLLNNIYRRKPIHSHSGQNIRLSDAEKQAYEEEIKRLQQDKSFLESELRRYQGQNHGVDFQIEVLRKQLQGMEQKQVRLMTCLAELMQKPGFTSLITQESDMHKKKRRLLEMDQLHVTSETSHLENLKLHDENCAAIPRSPLDLAAVEKLDNSLNLLENLLHEVDRTLVTQQPESGSLLWPLPATFAGRRESPEDSDRNFQTWSTASPASSKDVRSSPELPLCTDHVESPETSSVCLNMDISLKSSVIDMNLEPSSVPEVENLKEQILEKLPGAPTAVNDVFWEQFLTEAPCPSDSQEVQSERRDTHGTGSETNAATPGKFWWDSNYVNDLKKRMGNLAPAERV